MMKKVYLVLTLFLSFIVIGCSNKTTTIDKVEKIICNNVKQEGIKDITDVYKAKDGEFVTVCGIITAWENSGNFFIQDDTAGIYVYGNEFLANSVSQYNVGDTVLIKATKGTNIGLEQLYINISSKFEVIDSNSNRMNPVIINDFSLLISYQNELVKLINVNVSETIDNISIINDQNGNTVATIYNRELAAKNNVDVIGVYYNRNQNNTFVINSTSDILSTSNLSDEEKLSQAKSDLEIISEINKVGNLPLNFGEVSITWKTNNNSVPVTNGKIIYPQGHTENINLVLTATLSINGLSDTKIFNVVLKNSHLYQVPTDFDYDGPVFPVDAFNKKFWDGSGGLIKADLVACTDGDTARFSVHNNGTRFFNIDTQESTKEKEEWGKPASVYTCNALSNANEIYLQSDPGDGPLDKYDRLLAWIWVDGELLQYHLVSLGLAEVKYLYGADTYTDVLLEAQTKAQDNKMGQWGDLLDPYWDYEYNRPKGW